MDINQLCARKIRYLREFNNLTQDYVANELEMSQNAYSLLEKGTTKITIDRLVALAKIYNVSPFELLNETQAENPNSPISLPTNSDLAHSNYPPALSELERLMYEQTIARLETNIEKLYELIGKLTNIIADPPPKPNINHSKAMLRTKTFK